MNIQSSVIVWTIICFVLLMFILHNLLFKPVLKVMDDRKAHIEKANIKKMEFEQLRLQYEETAVQNQKKRIELRKQAIKDETEQIRLDCKKAIDYANSKRLADVENYQASSEEELEILVSGMNNNISAVAVAFAKRIISQ